ncbi:hypothetical protein H4R35_001801 [Dimargaris xerosporica]|nr:hypothetical protein H4R35_001801 [Dimargaris xerosporica]
MRNPFLRPKSKNPANSRGVVTSINRGTVRHYITLLKWFYELEQSDPAQDKRYLLLAEQRYGLWLELLRDWAGESNDIPTPPIDN